MICFKIRIFNQKFHIDSVPACILNKAAAEISQIFNTNAQVYYCAGVPATTKRASIGHTGKLVTKVNTYRELLAECKLYVKPVVVNEVQAPTAGVFHLCKN